MCMQRGRGKRGAYHSQTARGRSTDVPLYELVVPQQPTGDGPQQNTYVPESQRPHVLYHIARYADQYLIEQQGLQPVNEEGFSAAQQVGNEPGVYMLSEVHPDTLQNPDFDVWEVRIPPSSPLYYDTMNGATNSFFSPQSIPPQALQLAEPMQNAA